MTHELILTSVSQGLDTDSHGYCVVGRDRHFPRQAIKRLTTLSDYQHLSSINVEDTQLQPVLYSHLIVSDHLNSIGHVLSRIAAAGIDYQHNPNQLAHHIVLGEDELVPEGPAWLLALPGFHLTEWKTPSVCFDVGRPVPSLTDPPSLTCRQLVARERNWADPQKLLMTGTEINWETYRMIVRENNEQITMSAPPNSPCPCWQELTGDSGWGGVLAETAKTGQPALLLFQPGQNILPLFLESIAMLKPEFRWKTTFSTYYFKELPEHAVCQWKAVPVDSPIAEQLQNKGNHLVINLTRTPQSAPKGTYVEFARFGIDQLLPEEKNDENLFQPVESTKMNIHSPDKTVAKTRTTPPPVPPPITSQSVPVPPLEPFKIQTHPTSKTQGVIQGAMQSILNLPSRGQFYLLYGVTLLFILILLTLVIGQTADIGIFRLVFGTAKTNSSPNTPNQPNPASNNNGNSPEIKNDTYHASASDAEEKRRQEEEQKQLEAAQTQLAEQVNAFRKEIEKKKKQAQTKLNDFLLEPVLPPFLSMSVPMVRENQENNETIETNTAKELQLSSPPVKKFSELDVLFPFGLALDLKWIPLLDIPNVRVETRKLKLQRKLNSEQNQEDEIESLLETASEPEIKTGAKDSRDSKDSKYSDEFMVPEDRWFRWTVIAVDTETTTETPMFALELTEEGLAVTWQAEGLDNLRLYDTLTASLGFLRVQTENGDVNKNVDRATIRSIPLFEPKIQQPIRLAEHFADTEKPELITETPFAVPLWKTFFNTAKIPFAFQLNVTVKPELPENVKEVKLPKLESPAQFLAEFQTNIDSKKSMGAGNETFTPIAVSFDATLAPEQIVWRDRYNNQIEMLNQEKESKHNNLETIKKENETINKDLLTKGGTAASELRKKRNELSTEIKNTEIRIKEIESILANIPAAHESLIKDEQLRFEYSAYLIPFSREEDKVSDRLRNEESLLLMKTQSPPPISEQKNE